MLKVCAPAFLLILLLHCSGNPEYMPGRISGLSLSNRLTGKEAADFLNRLHLQSVTDEKTEIGFYSGEEGDAIIYLTYYSDADEAAEYEERMTAKISGDNTPFKMGAYQNMAGKRIFRSFGMGQTHFVFSHGNVLVWLSLGTTWANDFLDEYIEILQN